MSQGVWGLLGKMKYSQGDLERSNGEEGGRKGCLPGCLAFLLILLLVIAIVIIAIPGKEPTSGPTELPRAMPTSTPTPTGTPTSPAIPGQIMKPVERIERPDEPSGMITRAYEWRYAGHEWTWTLDISEAAYEYYTGMQRPPTRNWSVYVTHPTDDSYVEMLVEKIEDAAAKAGFDEWETVSFAVSFVQSLPYTSDSVTTPYDEYPRYPLETLVENGGDCEDTSILMAAILHEMDYGVVLLSPPGHMAVGVLGGEGIDGTYLEHNGGKYYYLETTGQGWAIGELPPEYEGKDASVYDIVPVPILTHDWEIVAEGAYSKLIVTVANWGTAIAYDVHAYAGFDAGSDMLWDAQKSATFDLAPGYSMTLTMYLTIPRDKHTRLVVQIAEDGYAVDTRYSKWFDTH